MAVLGYIIRLAYFLKERSIWGDELWTISVSDLGWRDMFVAVFNDVHPPLAFVFYKLFHYQVVPFISGLVCLWLITKITKDRLIWLIFSISPYFLQLGGEARGYGLLLMFSLMAIKWSWAFPLASLTEHYGLFVVLWTKWKKWMWIVVGASLCLIAYQTKTEQAFAPNRGFDWSLMSCTKKLVGLFLQFGGGVGYSFLTKQQAIGLSVWNKLLIVSSLLSMGFLPWARDKRMWKMLVIPIGVLFLLYPIRLNARYIPFCAVAYLFLVVDGYRRMPWRGKHILMTVYICANLLSLGWMFTIKTDPYHREDYITAVKMVNAYAKQNDGVLYNPLAEFYKVKHPEYNGGVWWETYQGNPDLDTNIKHWNLKLIELKKSTYSTERISDLVWVICYE